jgi:cytochrome c-type biogenesis protein CcmF
MHYVGEHLWAAELGRGLTAFSFIFSASRPIAYYLKGDEWKKLGRLAFRLHAVTLFGLIGLLFYIMANHYFEFDYVWKHTSLDLLHAIYSPHFGKVKKALSLLWMFWNAVLGFVILTFTARKFEGPVVGFCSSTSILSQYDFGHLHRRDAHRIQPIYPSS